MVVHTKIDNLTILADQEAGRVERLLGALGLTLRPQAPTQVERVDLLLTHIEDAYGALFTPTRQEQRELRAALGRLAKATRNLLLAVELLEQARRNPHEATRRRMRTIGELILDLDPYLEQVEESTDPEPALPRSA